ncbi:hypothetical protein [Haloarchaeobius sp. HME9146]|uniref:DUF7854 family protein n=1 Tax=Haloarchaeobius sp. HME9146 TaxID=2978732 RepID=UPI0021BFE528|nr:hypothetical protein [Haloarchaeobius sp. HME9146]MCT9094665.1 hypothetical protein [Haloarchaeobius sp. HME9146]
MDRISALRNVEEVLGEFERGEVDLAGMEQRVQAILRTYVSEFDVPELAVYRVQGDERGVVVVAEGPTDARARARELWADAPQALDVERVSD